MLIYQTGGYTPKPLAKELTKGAMSGLTHGISTSGPIGMMAGTASNTMRPMSTFSGRGFQSGGAVPGSNPIEHARNMANHQEMNRMRELLYQRMRDRQAQDSLVGPRPYMGPMPMDEEIPGKDLRAYPGSAPNVPDSIRERMAADNRIGRNFPPNRPAIADNKYGNPIYWDTTAPDTTQQGRGILYKCGGGKIRK